MLNFNWTPSSTAIHFEAVDDDDQTALQCRLRHIYGEERSNRRQMSGLPAAFELVLGDLSLTVPTNAITAKCKRFADTQHSPYRVRSNVSPDAFQIFVAAIRGDSIDVTSDNITDLTHLSDEFSFIDLQRELASSSLSAFVCSESHRFLSELEGRQRDLSRLERLVLDGFEPSVSRKMLILTGGDLDLARVSLSCLSRSPSEMSKFASATPIQLCYNVDRVLSLIDGKWPVDRGPFQLVFETAGGVLYSMSRDDIWEHCCYISLLGALTQHSVGSDALSGCPDTIRSFYVTRWQENKDNEAVFVMEGLSQAAARKLLVLARGRYDLAWQHLRGFGKFASSVIERGVLFSEMENRDAFARSLCASPDGLARFVTLAKSFTRASAVTSANDPGAITLIACQDAREFLQRDYQTLARVAAS
jgi:hypothetical protein